MGGVVEADGLHEVSLQSPLQRVKIHLIEGLLNFNRNAAGEDWLKLGAAEFYKKYGFRFQPRGSTLAEATRQMGQ